MMMKIGGGCFSISFLLLLFFVAEFGIQVSAFPSGLTQCPYGKVREEKGKLVVPTSTRACADNCAIYKCNSRDYNAGCVNNFAQWCTLKYNGLTVAKGADVFFNIQAIFGNVGEIMEVKMYLLSGCAGAKDPVTCMQKISNEYGYADIIKKYDTSKCKGEDEIWETNNRFGYVCDEEFDRIVGNVTKRKRNVGVFKFGKRVRNGSKKSGSNGKKMI